MTGMHAAAWTPALETPALRTAWNTVRLAETIDHAHRHVPRYRACWDAIGVSPGDFRSLDDLPRFPPTRKAAIAADPMGFVSDADPPQAIHDTSGTTGRRLPVYTNASEEEAIAALVGARSGGQAPGIVLRLLPPPRRIGSQRALPAGHPPQIRLPVLPAYDQGVWSDAVDQVANVIFDGYLFAGHRAAIAVIHTTPPPLLGYLSEQMVLRGIDPARAGVRDIVLTGGPIPAALRASLTQAWQARVAGSYTCAEIRGDSPECPLQPGLFHPSPGVFAEVLDPATLSAVPDRAHGAVALTGLYPYQRVMPMIRYLTGDIAERIDGPCRCGAPGMALRIVGRAGHGVDLSDAVGMPFFLGSIAVQDAIGACPHVPQFPYPRMALTRRGDAGGGVAVTVEVEATCPQAFDAHATALQIGARLIGGSPPLAAAVERGSLRIAVDIVEKNALSEYYRLYPGR